MSRKKHRTRKHAHGSSGRGKRRTGQAAATDILILSDGTVLAHNLTPGMAAVLRKINPKDALMQARASGRRRSHHS